VSPAKTVVEVSPPACSAFDPLTLSLHLDAEHAGRDVADDPMMVEIVASHSIIQTAGTPPLVLAAPAEDEAPEMPSPRHACGSLGRDVGQAGRDVAEDPMTVEVVATLPIINTTRALWQNRLI
jgi:hypothetical protein